MECKYQRQKQNYQQQHQYNSSSWPIRPSKCSRYWFTLIASLALPALSKVQCPLHVYIYIYTYKQYMYEHTYVFIVKSRTRECTILCLDNHHHQFNVNNYDFNNSTQWIHVQNIKFTTDLSTYTYVHWQSIMKYLFVIINVDNSNPHNKKIVYININLIFKYYFIW